MKRKSFLLLSLFLIYFLSNCILLKPFSEINLSWTMLLLTGGAIPVSSSSLDLAPGTTVPLSADGTFTGTLIDANGDGISDGIDLTGNGIPNILLLDTNGDGIPDAVDVNGDGLPDYYISPNAPPFLTTGPGGTGNPVVIIVDASGNLLGFDTDGDGTPNDTLIANILSDTIPPTVSLSLVGGLYSTGQNITISCSDNLSVGNIIYTWNGSNPTFSPLNGNLLPPPSGSVSLSENGSYTLTAVCRDLSGNISSPVSENYTIDSNVPSIFFISQTSSAVSIQVGAISSSTITWNSNQSGNYSIRIGGSTCSTGTDLESGATTANINRTFTRNASDFAGGESVENYRICVTGGNSLVGQNQFSLRRDDTPPVVTASPSGGMFDTVSSISLTCSDAGGSGCEKIAYTSQLGTAPSDPVIVGTSGNITAGTLYSSSLSMTDNSVTHIKYVARDNAGNVSVLASQSYTVNATEQCDVDALPGDIEYDFVENFNSRPITAPSTSYFDHSFAGVGGVTWNYVHSRDEWDYPIDGAGIVLRRGSEPSSLQGTISGGIRYFAVDVRKASTANAERKLELLVNGTVKGNISLTTMAGVDPTVHVFSVNCLDIAGDVEINLRIPMDDTSNRQVTVDNLRWTSYSE